MLYVSTERLERAYMSPRPIFDWPVELVDVVVATEFEVDVVVAREIEVTRGCVGC